jgi:hypothetical protein
MSAVSGEMVTLTAADSPLRELDQRTRDGVQVTLLWSPPANRVFVSVLEVRDGSSFNFEVAPTALPANGPAGRCKTALGWDLRATNPIDSR